jgi:hypothetical protein
VYGSGKLKAFDKVPLVSASYGPTSKFLPPLIIPTIDSVEDWILKAGKPHETPQQEKQTDPQSTSQENKKVEHQRTSQDSLNAYWSNYLTGLLLVSVTPGLPITMGLFALSLLLLTWAVLPSIVYELNPTSVAGARSSRTRSLGEWLSRGLDNTAILTRVLWAAIVPIPLIFYFVHWPTVHGVYGIHIANLNPGLTWATQLTLPLIRKPGLILAISSAAVFGSILKYLTTILDTLLDVDNYLRTSPREQTPRALVAERCTSLLRYVAAYRDEQGRPYDKVIVVAHSLGSIVATDLLRYLERSAHASPDPALARYEFRRGSKAPGLPQLPIHLFSMGSPLRQLLNRFFPHLYWWVGDEPDNSLRALPNALVGPIPGIIDPLPRIDEMNVTSWNNAYRSGDYVGRSLWSGSGWNATPRTRLPFRLTSPDPRTRLSTRKCALVLARTLIIGIGARPMWPRCWMI